MKEKKAEAFDAASGEAIHGLYKSFGEKHWYLLGRYDILYSLLKKLRIAGQPAMLDVGCGSGILMSFMRKYFRGEPAGCDYSLAALSFAQERGFSRLFSSDVSRLSMKNESIDLAAAIDVIEHVPDDATALRELYRILKPSGCLVLTVPAFMCLWGQHDATYGHQRRYRRKRLKAVIESAGFTIEVLTYMQWALFIPMFIFRKIKNILKSDKSDFFPIPSVLNAILRQFIAYEKGIIGRIPIPWGTNLVCIARKSDETKGRTNENQ